MTETGNVTHKNSSFNVIDGDLFVIHDGDNDSTRCEKTQNYLSIYFEDKLKQEFDFEEISLHIAPEDDNEGKIGAGATTTILATRGWKEAEKILIMTNNSSGSLVGIFSRSLCFEKGLRTGSVLNYVEKARECGAPVRFRRVEGAPHAFHLEPLDGRGDSDLCARTGRCFFSLVSASLSASTACVHRIASVSLIVSCCGISQEA